MKTVVWNNSALLDYHEIIDYLLSRWSEKEALIFIGDVEFVIYNLQKGNVEFKESGYRNIKQCILRKQITLYYKHLGSNKIELLRFWNNSQDHKNLKL